MSRFIAASTARGARQVIDKADNMLKGALDSLGPDAPVEFKDRSGGPTAYYLPVIYGYLGHKVEKVGDLQYPLDRAKSLLAPEPDENMWLPYLGETLDAGVGTLWAEEIIKGIEFAQGKQPEAKGDFQFNGPIDDGQLRSWGIAMVDGSMPGFAVVIGEAPSNQAAVRIVRELQARGQLVFLSGNVNGRSVVDQLLEEGVDLGYPTYTVSFGSDTESTVYATGYATRAAFSFGNVTPGDWRRVLLYNKFRCFAFALVLGPMDDVKWATGAGAIDYGFPAIANTMVPHILPTGVTRYEDVISEPWDDIPGDTNEKAKRLIDKCIEVRGIKVTIPQPELPVTYGPAFEGEVIRRRDMQVEFGSKSGPGVELLEMKDTDAVEDGKCEVVGPDIDEIDFGNNPNTYFACKIDVAGRAMRDEFEPVLERQLHNLSNEVEGYQHQGQREITWIRVSKKAYEAGLRLKHMGDVFHTTFHNQFGSIVDKIQTTFYTNQEDVEKIMEYARDKYRERDERIGGLKDESVDTFYSCTLCQSFAPTHVCVINPERPGLCGAYTWLDCRAAYEINPRGPNQPVEKGKCLDEAKGEFEGVNQFVYDNSQRTVERMTLYSLMDAPMTTCGCCECNMVLIPEANGIMIVSREDFGETPCGMKFTTLMGQIGGGQQSPGMMGHGKRFVLSEKFISAEGGLRRVVWMSKPLKEELKDDLQQRCEAIGEPDLMDKIADGDICTTVEDLVPFLEEKGHPALSMESMI